MLQQEQVLIQNHEMGGHSDILYWRIKSLGLCVRIHPNNYAHQLYGLTLLVGPFSPQLVEIYVNVNIRPLAMFERTLATPWQSIMADHHFCQFCSTPFLGSAEFPNCTKDNLAPLCWSHSVVSCRCMQIAILIQSGFMSICGRQPHQKVAVIFYIAWGDRSFSKRPVSGWSSSGNLGTVYLSARSKNV